MSCETFAIAAVVVVAATVAAMPPARPRSVDLTDAVNRTVCPIEIEIDEDPERVPRRIKVLRCAAEPVQRCLERGIPRHDCCGHHHAHHVTECVEIKDTVLVHYPRRAAPERTQQYRVAVGCTCMVERSTRASLAT